jgi:pyridoxal phosphate enzyme (YggS family)
MSALTERLARVRAEIAQAAEVVDRDPAAITLLAVSKTHPLPVIAAAAELGVTAFGENRVEEAVGKIAARPDLAWHMIGHVQSRKAADVIAAGFVLVHSLDSLKLAERLSRSAQQAGREQAVLLECNVSGEASKEGWAASDPAVWPALIEAFSSVTALPGLRVEGLMTMAPWGTDDQTARPIFTRLRRLRDQASDRLGLPLATLSMGMSDDFRGAIAEGSTLVRVGRALFGERG